MNNNHGTSSEDEKRQMPPSLSKQRPALPSRQDKKKYNLSIASSECLITKKSLDGGSPVKSKVLQPPSLVERDPGHNPPNAKTLRQISKTPPELPARRNSDKTLKNKPGDKLLPSLRSTCSTKNHSVDSPKNQSLGSEEKFQFSRSSTFCQDSEVKARNLSNSSADSTTMVQSRSFSYIGRDTAPKQSLKPKLPPRPFNRSKEETIAESASNQCVMKNKSALSMGFQSRSGYQKFQPAKLCSDKGSAAIQELVAANFDSKIRGLLAFIMFYNRHDWNHQQLILHWGKLAENFSFASDRVLFAQVDIASQSRLENRFNTSRYPTIIFFTEDGNLSEKFIIDKSSNLEIVSEFVETRSGLKPLNSICLLSTLAPPINLKSKPSVRDIQSYQALIARGNSCIRCRDFSGPDTLSLRYPRHSLPQDQDVTGYLAKVLCGLFQSSTDKARAIFTWLHHNIAYDYEALFGNRVKNVKPEDTVASGLAVCGGYAGLFEAIARKAGLNVITITGHGKGLGYKPMKNGDPVPPYNPSGHAWNAVCIDHNEWKLIDSCWGAGTVSGQKYSKRFSPREFTRSNEEFGIRHFPQDARRFYRSDGVTPSWEQYMRGLGPTDQEPMQEFGNVDDDYGISLVSFSPPQKYISLSSCSTPIRFQFCKICEHFDYEKNCKGKPHLFLLCLYGSNDEWLPFDNNESWWSIDIPIESMTGCKRVGCYAVTLVDGKDARGLTKEEYIQKKGRFTMNFAGISAWEVV